MKSGSTFLPSFVAALLGAVVGVPFGRFGAEAGRLADLCPGVDGTARPDRGLELVVAFGEV